jgi:hypothetical protein
VSPELLQRLLPTTITSSESGIFSASVQISRTVFGLSFDGLLVESLPMVRELPSQQPTFAVLRSHKAAIPSVPERSAYWQGQIRLALVSIEVRAFL